MNDLIQHWWAAIIAAVSSIVWLLRLEARANQNTRDLARLESRLAEQRREDMASRAADWGRMEAALTEMRADIKKLLERGA